jgi:hypothetical protein
LRNEIVEQSQLLRRQRADQRTDARDVACRAAGIGGDQVRYVEIKGKKLTIKTAPLISGLTGKQVVTTVTFERIE